MLESTYSAPGVPQPGLHEPFLARAATIDVHETGSSGLGAFLALRLVDQLATDAPEKSPAAVAYQLEATREFLRDLHQPNPESVALQEIVRVAEAASLAGDSSILIPPLLAFAYWLEEELRLEEALDVLQTALQLVGEDCGRDGVALHLQRARVLRLRGLLEDARDGYAEAGRLAMQLGDSHSVLLSRIGRAIVLQKFGNLPESERALRDVIADARLAGDRDAEARALHDLASTLSLSGRIKEAIPVAFRAFQLYEQPLYRARALSDTGVFLKQLGLHAAARRAFLSVLAHNVTKEVRAPAVAELLELSALLDDRVSFERWRREIAANYRNLPVEDQVDFEMKVGEGLARFGHRTQGTKHARQAIALAELHRLGERLFRAEELLSRLLEDASDIPHEAQSEQQLVEGNSQLRDTIDSLFALEASS